MEHYQNITCSLDEMALFDLPATVDKVLSISGAKELFYVGHSQGGAIGYAGLASNKTLASLVKVFAALAPAVLLNDIESPVRKLAPLSRDLTVNIYTCNTHANITYTELFVHLIEQK